MPTVEADAGKARIQSHRDLLVWQKGMDLAVATYAFSDRLPKDETFGLSAQMRRAAVSIPSNVAEGYGRDSTGAFVQHLKMAQGSLKELETQAMIAHRVGRCGLDEQEELLARCDELGRMLRALIRSLQERD